MNTNTESRLEPTALLDDIERRVNEIFSAQKDEVEQSLVARINREKEEAQKRIDAVNQEFAQVRGLIDEHKTVMAELQTTEEYLRGEIRGHFERAVNYQKMMENAAVLAGGELEKVGDLHRELEKVRTKAEAEYADLKARLSGYAGIIAKIPAPVVRTETGVDWTEEIGKMRQVRDLLASLRQAETAESGNGDGNGRSNEAPLAAAAASPATHACETAEELAASLGLIGPEDDSLSDDAELAENDPALAEIPSVRDAIAVEVAAADASCDAGADAAGLGFEMPAEAAAPETMEAASPSSEQTALLEALARYRRTEPVNNGIDLGFYGADAATVLDSDSFMAAVGKVVESACDLHGQLTKTTSVKDLFLLKQEILNQQEVLRKVFFRIVRFCDKEGGRLPELLSEMISAQGMKDIIERLTMANWSDPSDFKPFQAELKALKRAYETRTAATPSYLQSILDQVEGRDS